jgi:hypothetical protein
MSHAKTQFVFAKSCSVIGIAMGGTKLRRIPNGEQPAVKREPFSRNVPLVKAGARL